MIKIIISPAKKMKMLNDNFKHITEPAMIGQAQKLQHILKAMSPKELQKLWKCNDKIAKLNMDRLHSLQLDKNLTPALLSYEGIQYQYMAPQIFTHQEWSYVEEHLRILSGFYGILKPCDGVIPYRLEMQAKFAVGSAANLYEYWGPFLAQELTESSTSPVTILNLASAEYSRSIIPHLPPPASVVTCTFGEYKNGKVKVKATRAKMARGEMVRFMAEKRIKDTDGLKAFNRLGYMHSPELSQKGNMVFIDQSPRR